MKNIFNIFKTKKIRLQIRDFESDFCEVNKYGQELYSSSENLKNIVAVENQAVIQSSSALDEISSMLTKTSDNANRLAEMSSESKVAVHDGLNGMQKLKISLDQISQSSDNLNHNVLESLKKLQFVTDSLGEIQSKTSLINDIVFQTKLLSFNASVEAARAGEAGKGFSVVAEEMSNLAISSGKASEEITKILKENIESSNLIIQEMKQSLVALLESAKNDISLGIKNSEQVTKSFDQIVTKVDIVASLTEEISHATKEQEIGVREITKSTHHLNETSDELKSIAQKTIKGSINLQEKFEKIDKKINVLKSYVGLEAKVSAAKFDFDSARSAHIQWKMKLSKYLENPDGSLKVDVVCQDNQCALGKWIYGDGKKFAKCYSYEPLRHAHAHFHKIAAQIIDHANKNEINKANSLLEPQGPFMQATTNCLEKLDQLKSDAENVSENNKVA